MLVKGFCSALQCSCDSCDLNFKISRGQKIANQKHLCVQILLIPDFIQIL